MKKIILIIAIFIVTGCNEASPRQFTIGDTVMINDQDANPIVGIVVDYYDGRKYRVITRSGITYNDSKSYPEKSLTMVKPIDWEELRELAYQNPNVKPKEVKIKAEIEVPYYEK